MRGKSQLARPVLNRTNPYLVSTRNWNSQPRKLDKKKAGN